MMKVLGRYIDFKDCLHIKMVKIAIIIVNLHYFLLITQFVALSNNLLKLEFLFRVATIERKFDIL